MGRAGPVEGVVQDGEEGVADGEFLAGVEGDQRDLVADGEGPADVGELVGEHAVEEVHGDDER
jgi:hypothetical protein